MNADSDEGKRTGFSAEYVGLTVGLTPLGWVFLGWIGFVVSFVVLIWLGVVLD